MRLSIVIPVFEEERTIGEVIERVAAVDTGSLGFTREIIVCIDGGHDASDQVVERLRGRVPGLTLLRHARNRGKGAAIRTALAAATGDFVLIQDADLEYDAADYPALLAPLRRGADAVYGSRFLARRHPSGMKLANHLANRLLTGVANRLYGHRLTDEATCFKAIRTDLLRSLDLECERFEFCPEVTAKLGLRGIEIVEVPIGYRARDVAAGKKVGWRDGLEALWVLLKHRF